MNSKATELAKLMFGCPECVPGDRAAAAACPACQAVAQHIADCELDGDNYDDEDDEEEDDDYATTKGPDCECPWVDDQSRPSRCPSCCSRIARVEEAAEDKVGTKRKAAHGDDCECHSCDWDGGEQHRMLEELIDMKRRHTSWARCQTPCT